MLNDLFFNIIKNKVVYKDFPLELLSEFAGVCETPCVIIVSKKDLVGLVNINLSWEEHGALVVFPASGCGLSPHGFVSQYNKSNDLVNVVSGSLEQKIKCVFLTEDGFFEKLEPCENQGFLLEESVLYDDFVLFLQKHGYLRVDIVSEKGEYAIRGGIVDVFLHTKNNPIRCSFFDRCELSFFNITSQISTNKLVDCFVPSLLKSKDRFVGDLINDSWLHLYYSSGVFGYNLSADNCVGFPFRVLSYDKYLSLEKDVFSVSFLSFNNDVGFFSKNHLCVPSWYKDDHVVDVGHQTNRLMLSEFEVGDYLIHRDCGVGRFLGVFDKGEVETQDFIAIEYGDGKVFVDVHSLHKISYYSESSTVGVGVDFLSKRGLWEKKKKKVKSNLSLFVEELYLLYNKSQVSRSKFYTLSSQIEEGFVASFKYNDTLDQKRAWGEISLDLESDKCMDRLLCGDVGFGKTELAIRAAFKVVLGGGRVVVLAPTTILTKQLYISFVERLSGHGVNVSFLSRVKSVKEKRVVEVDWLEGRVDVLVGTHIVLNNDMYLKNSSLFIVDEEHRFGVKQKEKIRFLGNNVDYLSMSATPIPRTLGMALSGFKSISTLGSAPKSRKPIITEVSWYDEDLIKRVILQEYSRGGQVYFVNNNIKSLCLFFDVIKRLVPFARVEIVHGKMKPLSVEKIMSSFVNNSVDVLLCTSIVESGIDVQNANTIIVNNAHNFGLSQLYQIRGRVGRSSVQAFCYLMLPKNIDLNRNAFRRLKAIEVNTHLGAGYNISNMDLEIRGAGSVFGYKQSGGEAVGFELFSNLLNETTQQTHGVGIKYFYNVSLTSIFVGCIPDNYIENPLVRLSFYRRLNAISELCDIENIKNEVVDRFGEKPTLFNLLLQEFEIRLLSAKIGLYSVNVQLDFFVLSFDSVFWEPFVDLLLNFLNTGVDKRVYSYKYENKKGVYSVRFIYNGSKLSYDLVIEMLHDLSKII